MSFDEQFPMESNELYEYEQERIRLVSEINRLKQLKDYVAKECVGVQIGTLGHKLWVCIDGQAVLRVKAPKIELIDMRIESDAI